MTESIQLKRARHALERIRKAQEKDKNGQAEYRRAVRGLPAEIRVAGLGQALAMLHQRKIPLVYDHLNDWFTAANSYSPYKGQQDFLAALVNGSVDKYRIAFVEAEAYLSWLKRFAEIFLDDGNIRPAMNSGSSSGVAGSP